MQQDSRLDEAYGRGVDNLRNIEPLSSTQSMISAGDSDDWYIVNTDIIVHREIPLVDACSFCETQTSTGDDSNEEELIDEIRRCERLLELSRRLTKARMGRSKS